MSKSSLEGMPREMVSSGIGFRVCNVPRDGYPSAFWRAYKSRGPPIALTRNARSNSHAVHPERGLYVPSIARWSLAQIASALAPFLSATVKILETPAILF